MASREIKIVNCTTGEETVRAMTDAEKTQRKMDEQAGIAQQAELAAQAAARESALSKLAALGLTDAEIAALVGG
jgi:DNA-binding NarL/FixJ family response regulator